MHNRLNYFSIDNPYSFQGTEKDNEVKGQGNSVNYKYRMHDPRVGRFFVIDPLNYQFPHNSPYTFSENRVIDGIELEGAEYYYAASGTLLGKLGKSKDVYVINADRIKKYGGEENYKKVLGNIKPGSETHLKWINSDNVSKKANIDNDELNTRAFMSTIKEMENHGHGELSYDIWNRKAKMPNMSDHPGTRTFTENGVQKSSSAAGAYQIMASTWNATTGAEPKIKTKYGITDFSAESQDLFVLGLIDMKRHLLDDVKAGNIEKVFNSSEMRNEWTSTPGASQEGMSIDDGLSTFKKKVSLELQGDDSSGIAIKQGELFKK